MIVKLWWTDRTIRLLCVNSVRKMRIGRWKGTKQRWLRVPQESGFSQKWEDPESTVIEQSNMRLERRIDPGNPIWVRPMMSSSSVVINNVYQRHRHRTIAGHNCKHVFGLINYEISTARLREMESAEWRVCEISVSWRGKRKDIAMDTRKQTCTCIACWHEKKTQGNKISGRLLQPLIQSFNLNRQFWSPFSPVCLVLRVSGALKAQFEVQGCTSCAFQVCLTMQIAA